MKMAYKVLYEDSLQ